MIRTSSPGKVHLTSAHIVVYGKPALLTTIDLRVNVTLSEVKIDNKIKIKSNDFKIEEIKTDEQLITLFENAEKTWLTFSQNNDVSLLKKLNQDPLSLAYFAIGCYLKRTKQKLKNINIEISSQIPIGANFGSSASVSSAIIGALELYFNQKINLEKVEELVFQTEKLMHGKPSGADSAAVIYGGLSWFRKEAGFLALKKNITIPSLENFAIIDSGRPHESTAELVSLVRKKTNKRPKYMEEVMNKMEKIKIKFLEKIHNGDFSEVSNLIIQDERLLEKLGVVSLRTKSLIRDLERLKAAVGVSGAGGAKDRSGALVVYSENMDEIKNYVNKIGLKFYQVKLAVDGLRKEENEK